MPDDPPDFSADELIESCRPAAANRQQRYDAWQTSLPGDMDPFRRAFEDAAVGMAILDLDGQFLKVNRTLCQMFGYSEQELLSLNFQQITHAEDLALGLREARRALSGEISRYHFEKRYLHKSGESVWVIVSGSVLRDDNHRPCAFVSQLQDISDRKFVEQQSAQRLRSLQLLTHTANQILRAIEADNDEAVFTNLLQIALTAFECRAGMFLRFDDEGQLVGPFWSPGQTLNVRCPVDGCELWSRAFDEKRVVIENSTRDMGCGMRVVRSLVAPILYDDSPIGLVHLASAATDYTQDDCDLLARLLGLVAPAIRACIELSRLTSRESEVMELIVSGMSQKQIATALEISVQTVAKHRARVLEKLSARSDVDLVHFSHERRASALFGLGKIDYYGPPATGKRPPGMSPDGDMTRLAERPEP